ncbi:MAG: hypothetical protein COS84_00435 [Armatimonadetes bacterium CG07_land_8_20_14_0_80_40_9]|nr:MAG: hypothetical protein COS84_00435 [Armatimonadetes bacterium CG07_land_8_20_14_0_80_40_9]
MKLHIFKGEPLKGEPPEDFVEAFNILNEMRASEFQELFKKLKELPDLFEVSRIDEDEIARAGNLGVEGWRSIRKVLDFLLYNISADEVSNDELKSDLKELGLADTKIKKLISFMRKKKIRESMYKRAQKMRVTSMTIPELVGIRPIFDLRAIYPEKGDEPIDFIPVSIMRIRTNYEEKTEDFVFQVTEEEVKQLTQLLNGVRRKLQILSKRLRNNL